MYILTHMYVCIYIVLCILVHIYNYINVYVYIHLYSSHYTVHARMESADLVEYIHIVCIWAIYTYCMKGSAPQSSSI